MLLRLSGLINFFLQSGSSRMRLIFRNLAKETYTTMLAVTGILVLIFISHQFVHYLGDAASGKLTTKAVLQMMCIQVPLLLGFMLPLGLFLGILLTFGRWYADNEMTILVACGISKLQILNIGLILSSVVSILVAIIMFWIEPAMAKYRNAIIASAAISSPLDKLSPGRFQSIGNWVLYSEQISRDHKVVTNIFAANKSIKSGDYKHNPLDIVVAKKAYQKVLSNNETFIVLADGHRYLGIPGTGNYQITKFGEYGVRLPDRVANFGPKEEYMSFISLLKEKATNRLAFAEIQWRMAMPISVILLTLFAVPLSEVSPRKGRFAQIIPAIIIYILYTNSLFMGRSWVEKTSASSMLGLWWIHGLALLLALILLWIKYGVQFLAPSLRRLRHCERSEAIHT